jgi:DNA-directed RNA polymerase specialized sigma24 family protein
MYRQKSFTARAKFDLVIQALLNPNNLEFEERKYYAVLVNYIKCRLRQFNLYHVTIDDVISESYIRGVKLLESGQEIENPGAWIRVTSLNVIREMNRNRERQQLVSSNLREHKTLVKVNNSLVAEKVDDESLKLLELALQKLELKDYKIILWREIEGLSWKDVVRNLAAEGEIVSEVSARQRGRRALGRLRTVYFSIKSPKFSM